MVASNAVRDGKGSDVRGLARFNADLRSAPSIETPLEHARRLLGGRPAKLERIVNRCNTAPLERFLGPQAKEEPERFDEFTGPMPAENVPDNAGLHIDRMGVALLDGVPKLTRRGCSHSDLNRYEWFTAQAPTSHDLHVAQMRCGYHPHGYGGPDGVKSVPQPGGGFLNTWTSSGTCD